METIIKLLISALLGTIFGLEREVKKKPVGLKTSLVLTVASCLLTVISLESAETLADQYIRPMDPLRLPAQIVSGVGFIGAGAILIKNDVVSGLTTAAMIWTSVGIGIAVGTEFYLEAVATITLIMVGVKLVPFILKIYGPSVLRERELRVYIKVEGRENREVLKELKEKSILIKHHSEDKMKVIGNMVEMTITISVDRSRYTTDVVNEIYEIQGVSAVDAQAY